MMDGTCWKCTGLTLFWLNPVSFPQDSFSNTVQKWQGVRDWNFVTFSTNYYTQILKPFFNHQGLKLLSCMVTLILTGVLMNKDFKK